MAPFPFPPTKTISRIAILKAHPEKFQQLLALWTSLAEKVRANEPGCLQYTVYAQSELGEGKTPNVILVERYQDQEAFDAHLGSEHFGEVVKELVGGDLLREAIGMEEAAVVAVAGGSN